ncbi:MAG TPA: YihA family ribosome biogenesis GTP-binding protein [Thiotrichaceae bacterium]|nr:YihA family ribosome biogenesis GTP-binding protein [Thiotrichaceae bacterium]HIM09078.1 YihA family ribosome biogenesis GTP-binding protein [Gammaproteobacteria bacterium]
MPNGWYSRLEFKLGVAAIKQLPEDDGSEVAFAGRSNVGKSSVINKITHRRSLARISKSPGRTRELNYFSYDENTHLVDLPGYGYAKVNVAMRDAWAKLLERYLQERKSLQGVFLIMDVRHPMGKFDQLMLNYCQTCNLPLHVLLNKSDKLSKNAGNKVLAEVRREIKDVDASIQLFSALKGTGLDEARQKLADWLYPE